MSFIPVFLVAISIRITHHKKIHLLRYLNFKQKKKKQYWWSVLFFTIGKTGFEPATPWSQTKCSTKLSYFPGYEVKVIKKDYRIKKKLTCTFLKLSQSLNYAPKGSRTPNLLIRSQTLYPVELWVLNIKQCRGPESNRYGDHSPQDFKSCASASSATPA